MQTPILEGEHVRLEPLQPEHLPELEKIAFDPSIWKFMILSIDTPADLLAWAESGWAAEAAGIMMPWVTIAKGPNGERTIVGGTRFLDLNWKDRNVEIGNSWIAAPYRGTKVNTESKFLQLQYAFETLGFERVAFKAHAKNLRSQGAIKAIGARYEGTFRCHMLMPDGSFRDSAWFSIVRSEWPEVKDLLQRRLKALVTA